LRFSILEKKSLHGASFASVKQPGISTEHNLDLEFNSIDAQREACEV